MQEEGKRKRKMNRLKFDRNERINIACKIIKYARRGREEEEK